MHGVAHLVEAESLESGLHFLQLLLKLVEIILFKLVERLLSIDVCVSDSRLLVLVLVEYDMCCV